MMSKKADRHHTPQLCGNWDLRRSMDDLEIEERNKIKYRNAAVKKAHRRDVLKPYSDTLLDLFKGSSAERELVEITKTWAATNYNKELVHAASQAKSILSGHKLSAISITRYNIYLKITCHQCGIKVFDMLKL